MQPVLAEQNSHPRDKLIKFYPRGHQYEIISDPKSKYTSVTSWNYKHFPKFDAHQAITNIFRSKNWGPDHKYWGQTSEQIKASWKANGEAASAAGTQLHEKIENFMNNSQLQERYTHKMLYDYYQTTVLNHNDEQNEWPYFIQFVKDHPELKPYRTEWMIFDEELKIAGSVDMVYENEDGSLSIYDWKRSKEITKINSWGQFAINSSIKHLPDANFWHYSIQLNTYRAIIEKNYGKKVTKLCLVRLHPDSMDETYEVLDVPILEKELTDLFEERRKEVSK